MTYPVIKSPKDDFLGSRQEWTPSDGQDTFTGLTYTPGFLDIFVNGAKLAMGDFTATDGTTFVLASPVTDQDYVTSIGWFKGQVEYPWIDAKAGRKNLIINGAFHVNQREGTRTPGVGVYGYDRWKGHASGLEQLVEQISLRDGTYTLSWVGGGTGSLDGGGAAASPITASVTADHDVSVVVPDDATDVQIEPGDEATSFEVRPIGEELALCQRYYWTLAGSAPATMTHDASAGRGTMVWFPVTMRVTPTVSDFTVNAGTTGVTYARADGVFCISTAAAAGISQEVSTLNCDAEL